ncbi:hypothetical protein [uncultured Parvibaculum sp.]|uniref:hypothetical protein n=1 Tax=uncultured Parvibaculum sp. TaxID=291828 RepID=UPI0030D8DB6F
MQRAELSQLVVSARSQSSQHGPAIPVMASAAGGAVPLSAIMCADIIILRPVIGAATPVNSTAKASSAASQ